MTCGWNAKQRKAKPTTSTHALRNLPGIAQFPLSNCYACNVSRSHTRSHLPRLSQSTAIPQLKILVALWNILPNFLSITLVCCIQTPYLPHSLVLLVTFMLAVSATIGSVVRHEGYLTKKGELAKLSLTWYAKNKVKQSEISDTCLRSRKYFVLKKYTLFYYKNKEASRCWRFDPFRNSFFFLSLLNRVSIARRNQAGATASTVQRAVCT